MKIFDGKKVAEKILQDLKKEIQKENIEPGLAVILVGSNPESLLYISLKEKTAKEVGINFFKYIFPEGTGADEIQRKIQELNQDGKINGIVVQMPLPAEYNQDKILFQIDPKKDVDGFHPDNQSLFSPMILAMTLAIKESDGFTDKSAVALVNSEIFGKKLKFFLEKEGVNIQYRIKKTCPASLTEDLKSADILITACGCPEMIKGEMIKQGAILIDAGITKVAEKKVSGDVDVDSVRDKASFLTPVPGGIGPVTVALLLKNVFLASRLLKSDFNKLVEV